MSRHRRYTQAGADIKAGTSGKSNDPVRGEVCVLLRGARGPLMAGEIHPDAISHGKVSNPLAECIDHASAVLIRSHLRKRRRCTVPGAKPRLPVGRVHTENNDANAT